MSDAIMKFAFRSLEFVLDVLEWLFEYVVPVIVFLVLTGICGAIGFAIVEAVRP